MSAGAAVQYYGYGPVDVVTAQPAADSTAYSARTTAPTGSPWYKPTGKIYGVYKKVQVTW